VCNRKRKRRKRKRKRGYALNSCKHHLFLFSCGRGEEEKQQQGDDVKWAFLGHSCLKYVWKKQGTIYFEIWKGKKKGKRGKAGRVGIRSAYFVPGVRNRTGEREKRKERKEGGKIRRSRCVLQPLFLSFKLYKKKGEEKKGGKTL